MVHNQFMSNTYGTTYLNMACSRYFIASLQASSTKQKKQCKSSHCGSFVYTNLLPTCCYHLCSPCVLRSKQKRNNRPRILVLLFLWTTPSPNSDVTSGLCCMKAVARKQNFVINGVSRRPKCRKVKYRDITQ